MKKCLGVLLAVCLLPIFVACNASTDDPVTFLPQEEQTSDTQPGSDTTDGGTQDTGETLGSDTPGTSGTSNPATSGGDTQDKTPNFNGAEFKILSRQTTLRDFSVEQQGSTPIERAVYARNTAMENRFNIKLTVEPVNGDGWEAFYNQYYGQIASSTQNVSLVTGKLDLCSYMAVRGLTYDLRQLSDLKLTENWWIQSAHEAYGIEGKLYVALGDATHTIYESMEVVFVNETLARTHLAHNGTPIDLYDLVESGGWTWESFVLYTESVSQQGNDPTYGLVTNDVGAIALPTGMDVTVAQKQSNERWGFGATTDFQLRYDHIKAFLTQYDEVYYQLNETDSETVGNQLFTAGRALFYTQRLGAGATLCAGMPEGHTLGVLPFPKYDSAQSGYRTPLRSDVTALTVPKNVRNSEMTGVVIEALAQYGYETIRPEHWNSVLEGYLANADQNAMLTTVREGVTASFDMAYSHSLGDSYSIVPGMLSTGKSFADYYSANVSTWRENLQYLYAALG
ncbi:MAG: extracellular solute-binding protein [Clostridia bacterium]|nr:extracellular solute-binding protein [Clostridia bacterium]